ncbi:glycosyltransferase [uncultured Duncaniella sp.]|uniref:glycosyltransferase n=1 Tax=uncultured Duncaniella sp. TaxID=2768039 RepID=UPI0025D190A7|nr:glycosyltransferase [uncultured Duncaniella sp.]
MIQIYLVDYLGVHCGMHYYLEAFRNVLSDIPNTTVNILSNYPNRVDEIPFFINQYKGNKLIKGVALLKNLLRLKRFIKRYPNGIYIYLTYGNSIDLPFMRIVAQAHHHLIDIHEAIAQNVDANERLKHRFKHLYQNRIKAVISHSTRTNDFLKEYSYKSKRLSVPHFKYVFPKEYDATNISKDIFDATDKKRLNILFFGNLSESKGIDILLESVNLLENNIADKLNIIIAGKDFDGAVDRVVPKTGRSVKIIRRHITDDELRYLYQNVDYLSLPYRKTSQSGILEMAFYFKRPIIASDIPYFQQMLSQFPSFGVLAGNTAESYAKTLENTVREHRQSIYYTTSDYNKYENRSEIKLFISDFVKWLDIK